MIYNLNEVSLPYLIISCNHIFFKGQDKIAVRDQGIRQRQQ